jgi:diguanylate cyclase (GGDEF)-like protein
LRILSAGALKSLFVPGGVLLPAAAALVYSGWLTLPLPALSFIYYCAVAGGMLLAWRFHSSRVFLSLLILFLAQQASSISAGQPPYIPATFYALSVLVPINFVLIATMHERGFTLKSIGPVLLFFFVQSLTVLVFCGAAQRARSLPIPLVLPGYAMVIAFSASTFFVVRFFWNRKPLDSALLWSLGACFLALYFGSSPKASTVYWATSACILATSVIENSYLLAYHDELTALPSRRAFNDATMRLRHPYSIAVVDIDHFKRFNDTYGHDTGDQVLRLVAGNLARVTGGGQAYRCGGEEFNLLFSGRSTSEVLPHLEKLRAAIQSSGFRLRGNDRRQMPRGPDRRNQRSRTRGRKGDNIRQLTQEKSTNVLSVTVSIGVAMSPNENSSSGAVLESADKALYRAKANGRNRVETATSSSRRTRTKAAGIA